MNVIFDMETSDPDDFLTLSWLCANPKINLIGITITPGTQEQVGFVRSVLHRLNRSIPIGSFDPTRKNGCVSTFHYNIDYDLSKHSLPLFTPILAEADGIGANIINDCIKKYPDAVLLTGGPLKNLHKFLEIYPGCDLQRWVAQGGFAGDSLVAPEHRLAKFAGRETCPTFNFNGDVPGALLALSSNKIWERVLVSKNVCHGISYDETFHEMFKAYQNLNLGMNLIYKTMESYLQRHPKGKMLHDPLAACVMLYPDICTFKEVEVYRSKGEWGSRAADGTNTKISVSVDYEKFKEVFLLQK